MTIHAPLLARLHNVNNALANQRRLRNRAPRGSGARKRANAKIRRLREQRRKLRRDRWKHRGATAIVKYEVIPILRAAGVPVTSRKRWRTYGNPSSDHWKGNRDADAVDGGTPGQDDKLGSEIVAALKKNRKAKMASISEFGITRRHTGSQETYRVQVITKQHGTGPHVHIGVKRVSP